jgi:glycosyltransferase involved in cell wall biosynthesis
MLHKMQYENAKANLFSFHFWKRISAFDPDVIHIFLRPTLFVLCYALLMKILFQRSMIVVSALQPPQISSLFSSLIKVASPHLFIVLSYSTKKTLEDYSAKARVLPCGVDREKFAPVGYDEKFSLRKKYSVPLEAYVTLHVGHATKGRNLEILRGQVGNDILVIFVSSKSFSFEKELLEAMTQSGCRIFSEYLERIEEIYQLADCYVFPTQNANNAVDLPLSVLEAMACDLPVITTRFGALPELFQEDDSLHYFDGSSASLHAKIQNLRASQRTSSNREKVIGFDWKVAVRKLENIYQDLISGSIT